MEMHAELEEYEALLVAKNEAKDYEGAVLLLNSISYIHRTMGRWEQSLECLKDALPKAKKHSELATGNVLCSLGALYIEKGEIQTAISYLNDSLEYIEKTGNAPKAASAYGNLGKANFLLGRWDTAVEYVKKALDQAQSAGLDSNQMSSYTCLGKIESERGDFEKARQYFSLADDFERKIYEEIKEKIGTSRIVFKRNSDGSDSKEQFIRDMVHICELNIAEATFFRYQNKIEDAVKKADSAKNIAKQIQYTYGEIDALLELAKCYTNNQSNLEEQKKIVEEAIEKSKLLGAKHQEAEAKLQLAIILANEKVFDEAEKIFDQSVEMFNKIGNRYSGYIAMLNKGIFLFNNQLNMQEAILVMTGMQKIRELGKIAENIEVIHRVHTYIIAATNYAEKTIVDILNDTNEEGDISVLAESLCRENFGEKLILQNRILDLLSYLRILERSCSLAQNLSSNVELKNKSQFLKESTSYLIRVAESLNKTYGNQASIYENKLKEFRQEVEAKQNVLLQILQATLAGVGVTGIFTAVLSGSIKEFQNIHLIILALTFISWGMLPIAIYCVASKGHYKVWRWIFMMADIVFIILSTALFVMALIYPTILNNIL